MFLVIVFIVVSILLYLFLTGKHDEVKKVERQGGFYVKYNLLISYFLEIPNIQIEKKGKTSIILAVKDKNVTTRFTIAHGFDDVSIFWNHSSKIFGEHSLSWRFPSYFSQSLMIEKISKEMKVYENNLLGNGY